MSNPRATAYPPVDLISSTTAWAAAVLRSAAITFIPSCARRMAVAPPIFPGAAPATMATLSRSPRMVFPLLLHGRREAGLAVERCGQRVEFVLSQPFIEVTACEPQILRRLLLV